MEGFEMNLNYQIIGIRITELRKNKGWSQNKLAEKASISNNYLSNIENNHSIPSLETLMNICLALDITPNDILLGTSRKEKSYISLDIENLLCQCTIQEKRYILEIIKVFLNNRLNEGTTIQ